MAQIVFAGRQYKIAVPAVVVVASVVQVVGIGIVVEELGGACPEAALAYGVG